MGPRVTCFWSLFCHSCDVWPEQYASSFHPFWLLFSTSSSWLFIFYFLIGGGGGGWGGGEGFPRARPGPLHSSVFTPSPGQVLCSQGFFHLLKGSGPALVPVSWTAPLDIYNTSKRIYHSLSGQAYSPLPRRWHHYHPLRCQIDQKPRFSMGLKSYFLLNPAHSTLSDCLVDLSQPLP